ncbi:calcium-binding protein [Pseudodesulfovibrio sp.]|uniref:calcium-binding protein n=1 Tax=Pseudodesulfovibrio sp. TaxID=2035812 RepID=UPI002636DCBA|nr:calcium-binding protein [Pseudodesulfovibrio sp.]MDD3312060.1 calcium-binding protein [Pseudodesulfovibrio sp.]
MKRLTLFITLALTLLMAIPALAVDAPELRGTWKGKCSIAKESGFIEGQAAFIIDAQQGPLLKGYKLWFDPKGALHREGFVGVFSPEDGKIYFADGDAGYNFGQLTGKQTMSVYYVTDGATYKCIHFALERVHFTAGFMQIDRDGDKAVITAEITHYYPLNAERIMKEADTNKDGKLTKQEWEAWQKAH